MPYNESSANGEQCLNWLSQPRGPPQIAFKALLNVDEVKLVLRNLVLNATEAMTTTGSVIEIRGEYRDVSGREPQLTVPDEGLGPGPLVSVAVADQGEGMFPEVAERAFDPFFSTKFLGRGLGLSEVLGIMRGHHGAVRLMTEPGKGTMVQLLFPACEFSLRTTSARPTEAKGQGTTTAK